MHPRKGESSREFGLRASQILSALPFLTAESGTLCAALCTHVDDFFWAAHGKGEHAIQCLLHRFKERRIEQDKLRFCDSLYIQRQDGTIEINCRDNTRAIRSLDIPEGAMKSQPHQSQLLNRQR